MEVVEDILVWRTACKGTALSRTDTERLLETIDSVLSAIVNSSNASTVEFQEGGFRIANLPPVIQSVRNDDGKSLPQEEKADDASTRTVTQWSTTEQTIRKVLSDVSKIPKGEITKGMTVYHLGLDSISAIKVSSLLRRDSVELSVSELLKAATIGNMARIVDDQSPVKSVPLEGTELAVAGTIPKLNLESSTAVDHGYGVEHILPATEGQTYMLWRWRKSGGDLFHPIFHYKTNQILDRERLDRAWRLLQKHCSILRTTFATSEQFDSAYVQVILKDYSTSVVSLPQDNEDVPDGDGPDFSVPPVELYAQETSDDTHLRLKLHHALYDAVSLPILIQQLQALYVNPADQIQSTLRMEDFVARSYHKSKPQEKFWRQHLSGIKSNLIPPKDRARTSRPRTRTEVFRASLVDAGMQAKLDLASRRLGVSVQALFLAAYAKVHSRLIESSSFAIGIYLANRGYFIPGLETLPAPTVNVVPIRALKTQDHLMTLAHRLLADLQTVSSEQYSSVSLSDVKQWTGVEVDCVLNFSKVPGTESRVSQAGEGCGISGHASLVIEQVNDEWKMDSSRLVRCGDAGAFVTPAALRGNTRGDAYMASQDSTASEHVAN